MQMPAINVTIPIHVHPVDTPPDGRAGTFTHPHPLVRVKLGDQVRFQFTPAAPGWAFAVIFPGFSPLNNAAPITDANAGPFNAQSAGDYHYQVRVTDPGGNSWTIANCPELGVDL
jgi:hypothetical protein